MYNYFKNMVEENINQEFRLKNIGEARNYFVEDNYHKKVYATLNYMEHFLVLASTVTGLFPFLFLLF